MKFRIAALTLLMAFFAMPLLLKAQDDAEKIAQGTWIDKATKKSYTCLDIKTRSKDAFIKKMYELFGIKKCEDGIFEFKKVSLQNVGEDMTFLMIDGIWTQTKKALEFDAVCKDDMKALKENQNRGVRLVLRNTKGDDLLADGTKQDAFRTWLYTVISEFDK
jgi:hypothetical protein